MFSMCVVLLIFSSICTAVVGASETVTGHRGERVDIRCRYEAGYESNSKYFCKGECNFGNKIIMVKSGSPAKDERFSLTDDTTARVFTVSITDLRTEDTGQYWCAVERPLPDVFSEIMLLVKQDNKTTEVSTISSFSNTPSYFSTTEPNPRSSSITITERKETITDQHKSADMDGPFLDSPHRHYGSFVIIIIITGGLVLLICAVVLTVAIRKKKTCGLVSSSAEGLRLKEKRRKENASQNAVDTGLDYINVAAAVRNSVNPDQISSQPDASRQSHIYQSLTADSVQQESIYHSIDQTMA